MPSDAAAADGVASGLVAPDTRRGIPAATVERLPEYLHALTSFQHEGVTSISSDDLAKVTRVSSAKVRKDLSHLGSYGVRGVGYDVAHLAAQISFALGLSREWSVGIVGMGNLGRALASYDGFDNRGFHVEALFDSDPSVTGSRVGTLRVRPMTDIPGCVANGMAIGVIATPAESAQQVCDELVEAGIRSILNFAPVVLTGPDDVVVRKVDLAVELQVLAFHGQRHSDNPVVVS